MEILLINSSNSSSLKNKVQLELESKSNADIEVYKTRITALLRNEKIDDALFNQLKNELMKLFNSASVHILDNLTLLATNQNSALNNAIFPVKRNKIIQMEKEGAYIPLVTKNLFLKYYSDSDLQPYYWSRADKENYIQDIKSKLFEYLNNQKS